MMRFTLSEIWKWHAVLHGIPTRTTNTNILHVLVLIWGQYRGLKKNWMNSISATTPPIISGHLTPQITISLIIMYGAQLSKSPTKLHVRPKMKVRIKVEFNNLNKETIRKACRRCWNHLEAVVKANRDFFGINSIYSIPRYFHVILVGWLDFMTSQPLGYFRLKMFFPPVVKSRRKRQQETDSCINSREDTVVSFTLSPSLSVAVPSFFLSLLQVLAFLPSFSFFPSFLPSLLPSLRCNTFVGQMHSEQQSRIQPLPCVFVLLWDLVTICIRANYLSQVRDLPSSNMLEAAISVFTLQARHVHACFECPGTLPSHPLC